MTYAVAAYRQGLRLGAATGAGATTPGLVVWHPRLKLRFSGDDAWKRAVRLSVHAPKLHQSDSESGALR